MSWHASGDLPGQEDTQPLVLATEDRRPSPAGLASFCDYLARSTLVRKDDPDSERFRIFWRYMATKIGAAEVFDFGQLPDHRMREEAVRGGVLMGQNLLQPPYEACVMHYSLEIDPEAPQWVTLQLPERPESVVRYCTAVVGPVEWADRERNAYLCVDFMRLEPEAENDIRKWSVQQSGREPPRDQRLWMVAGAALIRTIEGGHWDGYLIQGEEFAKGDEVRRRSLMGSLADGIAGLSMILCTRGVPIRKEPAPAKLNAKRARNGKPPLPAVTYVDTRAYLEAADRTARGGHHASPVPHLRRGHVRTYRDGSKTWVRSALVNCRSREELAPRDHYEVRA